MHANQYLCAPNISAKTKNRDTPYRTVWREYMFGQSLIVELQHARGKLLLFTLQHYGIMGSEKESRLWGGLFLWIVVEHFLVSYT